MQCLKSGSSLPRYSGGGRLDQNSRFTLPNASVEKHSRSLRVILATLLLGFTTGCFSSDSAKTSLFEEDHVNPLHWPSGLSDIATKIRARISTEVQPTNPKTAKEIEDLVSWVGEIAADTDLSESDWVPLYSLSESVIVNLRTSPEEFSEADREAIENLCVLIEETSLKMPEGHDLGEDHP